MSEQSGVAYQGQELELFALAGNWKRYWRRRVSGFIGGKVLEVGAGIGTNTWFLQDSQAACWTCLEPDARFCKAIQALREGGELATAPEVVNGVITDLPEARKFDTILYIDVLEHIEDDRAELVAAAARLTPGGHLIVLSPAWQCLYSAFDQAIGHYRRYCLSQLQSSQPNDCRIVRREYLDVVGVLVSFGNSLLLRQETPTVGQIKFWDQVMVPASRILDPLLMRRLGRSVLVVWQRQ